MAITPKAWEDEPNPLGVLEGRVPPTSRTPLNAAALRDLETRMGAYADSQVSLIPADGAAGTASLRTLGGNANQAAAGNRGLPSGGTAGQVLAKTSSTNYAVAWVDAATGGGGSGVQVVMHGSNASTARPDVEGAVFWVGSVEPLNMANGDIWLREAA